MPDVPTSGPVPADMNDIEERLRALEAADLVVGMGQLHILAAGSAETSIAATDTYYEVAGTWNLTAGLTGFDESAGNGRLTYVGDEDIMAHIACSISMTVDGVNDLTHWRLGKNTATVAASEVQRYVSTGTDVGSTALHLVQLMSTGDYVSLWVRNAGGTDGVTAEVCNLQAVSMTM